MFKSHYGQKGRFHSGGILNMYGWMNKETTNTHRLPNNERFRVDGVERNKNGRVLHIFNSSQRRAPCVTGAPVKAYNT